jgi:hypothetical protein
MLLLDSKTKLKMLFIDAFGNGFFNAIRDVHAKLLLCMRKTPPRLLVDLVRQGPELASCLACKAHRLLRTTAEATIAPAPAAGVGGLGLCVH